MLRSMTVRLIRGGRNAPLLVSSLQFIEQVIGRQVREPLAVPLGDGPNPLEEGVTHVRIGAIGQQEGVKVGLADAVGAADLGGRQLLVADQTVDGLSIELQVRSNLLWSHDIAHVSSPRSQASYDPVHLSILWSTGVEEATSRDVRLPCEDLVARLPTFASTRRGATVVRPPPRRRGRHVPNAAASRLLH